MKAELDFRIPEPERIVGGNYSFTKEILQYLLDNSKIDRKFNHYLKDKSVILVGPASYMLNQDRREFIDSHDIVVRLNRGWKIKDEHQQHFGTKTNIRYHCGMVHENNGGAWDIQQMIEAGVEYAAISFPKNLDYFHDDITRFEQLNEDHNMNFHYFSDLELYTSIHHYLGTRMAIGMAAFIDLLFYDIKSLHVSGITFGEGGWFKGYKQKESFDKNDYMKEEMWTKHRTIGNHAMIPQRKLMKLCSEIDSRISFDPEVEEVISI